MGIAVAGDTTHTYYGGDRTTVIPPSGGTTQTTVVDARGATAAVQQYTAAPTITGNIVTGGAHQDTTYSYDALGRQTGMTDPGGAQWTTGYDLAGRTTSQNDPDTGTTTTGYDDAGDITSTTDARGTTLTYTYDTLGRETREASGSTALASWVYDTLQAGQPTSSTRITAQGNYVVAAIGYDVYGNSTGTTTTIPAAETGLSGTYTTKYSWTKTHLEATEVPLAAGSLIAETLSRGYTRLGNPTTTVGTNSYIAKTTYDPYGNPTQLTLGTNNQTGWLTYTRDPSTHNLTAENLSIQAAVAQVDNIAYSYNTIGDITHSANAQGSTGGGAPTETTCYTYNALDQLTQTWTAASCTTPAKGAITGPQPYWTSWSIDSAGDRTQQIQHGTASGSGDTTTNYTYTYTSHVHAATTAATTSPTGTVTTAGYGYDQNGDTTTRTGTAGGNQTLAYNTEGRTATITSAGTTTYIYDANGNELVRRDPTLTTIFLPNEQVSRTNTGTVTGTRWYSQGGITTAERINAYLEYAFNDINNTSQTTIPTITGGFGAAVRRHTDTYGNPVGAATGTWLDHNGYLGQPQDTTTKLTDLGPRQYDPTLGKFLTVDPILAPYNPAQNNGYSYGWNNPLGHPDPTGAAPNCNGPDGEGCHSALSASTGAAFVNPGDGYTPPAQDTGGGSGGDNSGCDRECDNSAGGGSGGSGSTQKTSRVNADLYPGLGSPSDAGPGQDASGFNSWWWSTDLLFEQDLATTALALSYGAQSFSGKDPLACAALAHFLDGSGTTMGFDAGLAVSGDARVRTTLNGAVVDALANNGDTGWNDEGDGLHMQSGDLYLAIHDAEYRLTTQSATQSDGSVTLNVAVSIYKSYNFDPGSTFRLPYGVIGTVASQTVLSGTSINDLVSAGQARNFDLKGTALYQVTNYSGQNVFGP